VKQKKMKKKEMMMMSNVDKLYEEYNLPQGIIELMPEWLLRAVAHITPEELIYGYEHRLNIDEAHPQEVIYALSFYETLSKDSRKQIQDNIDKLDIRLLLEYIGRVNEKLFNTICDIHEKDVKILTYLEIQIERIKKLVKLFEKKVRGELIGTSPNSTTTKL